MNRGGCRKAGVLEAELAVIDSVLVRPFDGWHPTGHCPKRHRSRRLLRVVAAFSMVPIFTDEAASTQGGQSPLSVTPLQDSRKRKVFVERRPVQAKWRDFDTTHIFVSNGFQSRITLRGKTHLMAAGESDKDHSSLVPCLQGSISQGARPIFVYRCWKEKRVAFLFEDFRHPSRVPDAGFGTPLRRCLIAGGVFTGNDEPSISWFPRELRNRHA